MKSIAAGNSHTCALLSDGTVKCWGYPGNVGSADPTANGCTMRSCPLPVTVSGITDAIAIAAQTEYTCVVLGTGAVSCWGITTEAECCDVMCSTVPVTAPGITNAVSVSFRQENLSVYDVCALQHGGTVQCAGGASCVMNNSLVPTPRMISDITDATGVSGTCAVLEDGDVKCWDIAASASAAIPGITNAVGVFGTYAVLEDGTVQCWSGEPPALQTVSDITGAIAVTSNFRQGCAVLEDGTVQCWSVDGDGRPAAPSAMAGVSSAVGIASGVSHVCVLLSDGAVQCWGDNLFGQLGDGTTEDSVVPVMVNGL